MGNSMANEKAPDPTPLHSAAAAFLDHARDELGLSPATLDAYRRDLGRFIHWTDNHKLCQPDQISHADVRGWAAAEHRRGLSPRSIQRALSALRRWFRYLRREGLHDGDPTADVRAPKQARKLPRPLDIDQLTALLEIPEEDELAIRDRAMLELFYASGLRLSELAGLTWRNLDLDQGLVRVLGKGRKERLVPVGRHAVTALKRWRPLATGPGGQPGEAVFLGRLGKPLGVRAIQKRVAYWSQRQGLDQTVHPHQLRHSFASHILESSGDLRAVQELLGHANLSTTQIYTHLDYQHLAQVYDQTHPRAKKQAANKK